MSFKSQLLESLNHEDDLGMVIRAHIVIEQILNEIIKYHLVDFDSYKKVKLSYEQTYLFAIAIGVNPKFKSALKAIGTIRNGFAHNLRATTITKQDSDALYKSLAQDEKDMLQTDYKGFAKFSGQPPFNQLSFRNQFMFCIVKISTSLESVLNQLPNKPLKCQISSN